MGKRCCSVPGCKTGYPSERKKEGTEKRSLFCAKNEKQLEMWCEAMDKELRLTDKVCDLHFAEDAIDKYYETVLPDGTSWKMIKGRPTIKEDAVPTLLPNLPCSRVVKKRKPPLQHTTPPKESRSDHENEIHILDLEAVVSFSFTFSMLISNLKLISKPNALWGITAHDSFLMCAKWSENRTLEKRVIVDNDLKVQVFLKDRECVFENICIGSVEDLSSFLSIVDSLVLCLSIDDVDRIGCHGYVPSNSRSKFCENCRTVNKKEVDKCRKRELYRKSVKKAATPQTYHNRIRYLSKTNLHLKQKVDILKNTVQLLKMRYVNVGEEFLNSDISDLPQPQQEAIKDCLDS